MSQNETYPFELAKIFPTSLDISKRWYIEYKIWHHGKGELVTQRIMGNINRIKNKEKRLRAARIVFPLYAGRGYGWSEASSHYLISRKVSENYLLPAAFLT